MDKLIVSLKWTRKTDKWITFWRTNSSGYCWFKEWCGLYPKNTLKKDNSDYVFIDSELVKDLWIKVKYEGYEREVLPNTLKIRNILGIKKSQLRN